MLGIISFRKFDVFLKKLGIAEGLTQPYLELCSQGIKIFMLY
jgi:hypothetical protein